MRVIEAIQVYEKLVQQHSSQTYYRSVLRTGTHAENLKLWRPFCRIVRFCARKGIAVQHYLQAQFSEWVKPNKFAADYPTAQYLGVNLGCIVRYKTWRSRMRAARSARQPEAVQECGEAALRNIMASRTDLKRVADVLCDPFLIRLLPPDFVKKLPEYHEVEPVLRSYATTGQALTEYL